MTAYHLLPFSAQMLALLPLPTNLAFCLNSEWIPPLRIYHTPTTPNASVPICLSHNPLCGWFCLPTFPNAVYFFVAVHVSPPSNYSLCRAALSRFFCMQEHITTPPMSSNKLNSYLLNSEAASKKAVLNFKVVLGSFQPPAWTSFSPFFPLFC